MSITVSASQTAISTVQAGGSTTKSGGTSGDSGFLTTLSQCMNQDCTAEGSQMTSVVLPTIGGLTEISEEEVDPLMSLIESLLKDLEQANQALEEDPEMLAMLQQWLVQAQGLTGAEQFSDGNTAETLQLLAANPATLSILVRDQLEQLRSMLNTSITPAVGSNSNTSAVQEGVKLLEALQVLLNRAQTVGKTSDSATIQSAQTTATAAQLNQTTNGLNAADRNNSVVWQGKLKEPVQTGTTQIITGVPSANGSAQEGAAASVTSESSAEVVTAGQFALRAEGMQTAKPVQVIRAGQFVQDMGNFMVKQLHMTARNGVSEAKITLYPETLGQVDIRLTMQNGQLIAQFVTEHAMAKEMLDQQMSLLRGALQAQGIQVEKLEVSQQVTTASDLSGSMFHRDQQSNSNRDQSSSQQARNQVDFDSDYESLEDIKNDIIREQLRGSSFQASV